MANEVGSRRVKIWYYPVKQTTMADWGPASEVVSSALLGSNLKTNKSNKNGLGRPVQPTARVHTWPFSFASSSFLNLKKRVADLLK